MRVSYTGFVSIRDVVTTRHALPKPCTIMQIERGAVRVTRATTCTKYTTLAKAADGVFNYNPITEYSTDGVHLNPEFGIIRSAHDPRQIQLAARFDF
jgi:hypothetical protein